MGQMWMTVAALAIAARAPRLVEGRLAAFATLRLQPDVGEQRAQFMAGVVGKARPGIGDRTSSSGPSKPGSSAR